MITNRIRVAGNRQEVMQRVTPGFPMSVYHTDFSEGRYKAVTWHWHDDFQFCWVTSGNVRFRAAEQTYELTRDNGIFINCRVAHTAEPVSDAPSSYFCLNGHPDLICPKREGGVYEQMLRPFLENEVPAAFLFGKDTPHGSVLFHSCRKILSICEQTRMEGRELLMHSEFLRLWPAVVKSTRNRRLPVRPYGDPRFKTIITYIRGHYSEKIKLQDIAALVHLSAEECSRYFRRVTGSTLFQFIMQYRIDKSTELLLNSDLSIAEISQRSGFSSQSYYTACFQRYEGCTPNQYRKSARKV